MANNLANEAVDLICEVIDNPNERKAWLEAIEDMDDSSLKELVDLLEEQASEMEALEIKHATDLTKIADKYDIAWEKAS